MNAEEALFLLHETLPQQGPGSDESTLAALAFVDGLPPEPCVLDLGCGCGRQTLALARALSARIVAVDIHQPYLDQLENDAAEAGLASRITVRAADFGALACPDASFDLIWSEGAAYQLGFRGALKAWRRLLRSGGWLVVSECAWFTDTPPADVSAFWRQAYPGMATVTANADAAAAEGYVVLETMALPASDWWEGYYGPLRERMAALRGEAAKHPALAEVIAETEQEMAVFAQASESYGYVFYVLKRTD